MYIFVKHNHWMSTYVNLSTVTDNKWINAMYMYLGIAHDILDIHQSASVTFVIPYIKGPDTSNIGYQGMGVILHVH